MAIANTQWHRVWKNLLLRMVQAKQKLEMKSDPFA